MKFRITTYLAAAALGLLGMTGAANATILLTPANTIPQNLGPSNCEPGCVESYWGVSGLNLLYKADVGLADSGAFASSYTTTFLNTANDPSGALIEYVSGPSISCPSCYLAIKDGNQNPSYYFYNLSAWNGTESISLSGFWPEQGAISHISIWGTGGTTVPEPSMLGLMGIGLLGVALARRKKKA